MSILTNKQKTFLDELEQPREVAAFALQRVREGHTDLLIKNGRQMQFRGIATLKALADYVIDKPDK